MKRQVFFSFHYDEDVWRVAQVRNMGVIEGQALFNDNGWEKVRYKSEFGIKAWIDKELKMRSCVVVLVGTQTASRKWVQYEIEQAWKLGKGIVAIHIHNLSSQGGKQSSKGKNPLSDFYINKKTNDISRKSYSTDIDEIRLDYVCKTYDSPYILSQNVYHDIQNNIARLIEEAISIRNKYPK